MASLATESEAGSRLSTSSSTASQLAGLQGRIQGGHRGQMTPLPICAYSKTSASNNYSNRR